MKTPTLSQPLRAAAYAGTAMLFFSMMSILIRQATLELHPLVVVFFRNFFALLIMLPWLARQGIGALRTERLGLYLVRSGIGILGMTAGFWSLTLIPLAQATASPPAHVRTPCPHGPHGPPGRRDSCQKRASPRRRHPESALFFR